MPGVSRFDCYPSDFLNGIIGLSGDEIAVYTVVMILQYDRGEPVPHIGHERELVVRSGLSKKRCASALERLLQIGKLSLSEGCLSNSRAAKELEIISKRIQKNSENAKSGGNATREKWSAMAKKEDEKRNEINDDVRPIGLPDATPTALQPLEQPLGPARARPSPSPSPSPSPNLARLTGTTPEKTIEVDREGNREWNEIELAARNALGDKAPDNFVIGPIVALVRQGITLSAVVDVLRSEARRDRKNPIRTWQIWAEIVVERLNQTPKITKPGNGSDPNEPMIDIGTGLMPQANLVRMLREPNGVGVAYWTETFVGSRNRLRSLVERQAPQLMHFWTD